MLSIQKQTKTNKYTNLVIVKYILSNCTVNVGDPFFTVYYPSGSEK